MILDEIAEKTKKRIEEEKQKKPLTILKNEAEKLPVTKEFPFEKALKTKGLSFICEIKRASPSKGMLAEQFPYLEIAKEYEKAGASAISVLTEPYYFKGSSTYLRKIRKEVSLPILRKDFVVDEYMIYEAKIMGADAILLIGALLEEEQLKEYLQLCEELGLSALVEVHDETELARALRAKVKVIGVNNRDLKTFMVDIKNSIRLRELVPEEIIFVSESGIRTTEDIRMLQENKTNAVLIGETLMKSKEKEKLLNQWRGCFDE